MRFRERVIKLGGGREGGELGMSRRAVGLILLNAAGGQMWTPDLKKVAFDTPQGLAAMQTFYTFMYTKKYVDPLCCKGTVTVVVFPRSVVCV